MNNNVIRAVVISGLGLVTLVTPIDAVASDNNTKLEANQLLEKENKTETEAHYLLASISSEQKKQEWEIDSLLTEMTVVQSEVDGIEKQIVDLEKKNTEEKEKEVKKINSDVITISGKNRETVSLNSVPLIKVNKGYKTALQLEKIKKELAATQLKNNQATEKLEKEIKGKSAKLDTLAAKLEVIKTKLEQTKLEKESAVVQLAAKKADVQTSNELEETSSLKKNDFYFSGNYKNNVKEQQREKKSAILWQDIKQKALNLRGTPYKFEGITSEGFDSSGFIAYIFEEVASVYLPHDVNSQHAAVKEIPKEEAEAGDLIFFSQTGSIDHVGIYLGEDSFISAQSSSGVSIKKITSDYWGKYIIGYGRVD